MANITQKTSSNVFYKARSAASKHNDQLSSREGAAEIMAIERGRMYRIEKGNTYPYPEEVRLMADLYNAPELENHYCTEMCALGRNMPKVDPGDLDRISLRAVSTFRKIETARELLLDITEDGIVSEDEKPDLRKVMETLEELETITQSLKIWVKKNL